MKEIEEGNWTEWAWGVSYLRNKGNVRAQIKGKDWRGSEETVRSRQSLKNCWDTLSTVIMLPPPALPSPLSSSFFPSFSLLVSSVACLSMLKNHLPIGNKCLRISWTSFTFVYDGRVSRSHSSNSLIALLIRKERNVLKRIRRNKSSFSEKWWICKWKTCIYSAHQASLMRDDHGL